MSYATRSNHLVFRIQHTGHFRRQAVGWALPTEVRSVLRKQHRDRALVGSAHPTICLAFYRLSHSALLYRLHPCHPIPGGEGDYIL